MPAICFDIQLEACPIKWDIHHWVNCIDSSQVSVELANSSPRLLQPPTMQSVGPAGLGLPLLACILELHQPSVPYLYYTSIHLVLHRSRQLILLNYLATCPCMPCQPYALICSSRLIQLNDRFIILYLNHVPAMFLLSWQTPGSYAFRRLITSNK